MILDKIVYLKGKIFSFRINETVLVDEFLDDFPKIVIDLENNKVKVDVEDLAILVLNAVPSSYAKTLSLDEVLVALKSKKFDDDNKASELSESLLAQRKRGKILGKVKISPKIRLA